MAKSKNHTNHNVEHKAHRNGIKRPAKTRYVSLRGTDLKYRKNRRFAQAHDPNMTHTKQVRDE
jgi:large subunit ribosomal protein L29e